MESAVRKNQLEEGLINALTALSFEEGKISNADETASIIVEAMAAHFTDNGSDTKDVWTYIGPSLRSLQQQFSDENSYIAFLNHQAVVPKFLG